MSNYFTLVKVLFKNSQNPFTAGKNKTMQKLKKVLGYILMVAIMIPLFMAIVSMISSGYDMMAKINQQSALLGVALAVNCMILLIFGVFYVINEFYYSSKLDILLPLPLAPETIFGAKFTLVVLYEYLSEIIFLAPVLIAYGYKSGAGVMYYVYAIIIYLLLPVIPLAIDAVFCMIVMRFTNIFKNKDLFKVLGGMLAIGIGFGSNIVINSMARNKNTPQALHKLLTDKNGLLNVVTSKIFPTAKIAAQSLSDYNTFNGFRNVFNFFFITFLAILVLVIISKKLYFKGALGMNQTTAKKKAISQAEMVKSTSKNSVIKALIIKDFKIIIRTPAYFINCFIMNYVLPFIMIISAMVQTKKIPNINKLNAANTLLKNQHVLGIALLVIVGACVFLVIFNPISATAISREGTNIFVNKYIPVDYNSQILSKVILGTLINFSGLFLIEVAAIIVTRPPIIFSLIAIVITLLATAVTNVASIIIDLLKPKLVWDDETKAVKQNINPLIAMVVTIVMHGAILYLIFKLSLSFIMTAAILSASYLIIIILLGSGLKKWSDKLFANL